jgi:hypothetical protein
VADLHDKSFIHRAWGQIFGQACKKVNFNFHTDVPVKINWGEVKSYPLPQGMKSKK